MSEMPELAVQALITNPEGKILLRKRMKEPDQGKWQVVAGSVRTPERLEDTVQRLLKEKVGIEKIDSIEFTGHYYDDPNRHPGTHCIPLSFLVKTSQDTLNLDGKDEASWFSPKEVSSLKLAFDNRQSLSDLGLI